MSQNVPSKTKNGTKCPNKSTKLPTGRPERANAIPLESLLHYRKLGLSYQEVANQCGCSKANIVQRLHYHNLANDSLRHYVDHRVDYLRYWQRRILESITDEDLKKANFASKLTGYGILYDKERLELGQSTGNLAILHLDVDRIQSMLSSTMPQNSSTISTKDGQAIDIDAADVV